MSELGEVLEAMYSGHRRFRTVRADIRHWYDAAAKHEALVRTRAAGGAPFSVLGVPGDTPFETVSHLYVERPSRLREERDVTVAGGPAHPSTKVVDGQRQWTYDPTYGARHGEGHPKNMAPPALTGLEHLLDPRPLLGPSSAVKARRFGLAGEAVVAERTGARLLGQDDDTSFEIELVVDMERGVVLRHTEAFDGRAFEQFEMLSLSFDDPLPPDAFRFTAPLDDPVLPVPEWRDLTVDEAARLASFEVVVPASLPENWSAGHVTYTEGWHRATLPGEHVTLSYVILEGELSDLDLRHLSIHQAADPPGVPSGTTWERMEHSGRLLAVWRASDREHWIVTRVNDTWLRLQSDLDLDTLLGVVASLAPVPGDG